MTTANETMSISVPPNGTSLPAPVGGTGLVDTMPGVQKPRLAVDDLIVTTEEAIRAMTLEHVAQELKLAMSLLEHGAAAAPRALHLVEGLSRIHAEVLVLLGMGPRPKRGRRAGLYINNEQFSSNPYSADADVDYALGATSSMQMGGETYGNRALEQLVSILKPIFQQSGLFGMAANAAEKPATGMDIMSLTSALASAKRDKLGKDVTDALTKKLKEALDGKAPEPTLIGQPLEAVEVVESAASPQEEVGA